MPEPTTPDVKVSGLAWDLTEEELARRGRIELAKKSLEPTLPWRMKIVFENPMGEEIATWDTGLKITSWDSRVELRFSPATDIEMGT